MVIYFFRVFLNVCNFIDVEKLSRLLSVFWGLNILYRPTSRIGAVLWITSIRCIEEVLYSCMQSVLLTPHICHQWTPATKWWPVNWTGLLLVKNVDQYIQMPIYSSSMMHWNNWQLMECSFPSVVSLDCLCSSLFVLRVWANTLQSGKYM